MGMYGKIASSGHYGNSSFWNFHVVFVFQLRMLPFDQHMDYLQQDKRPTPELLCEV